jgi:acetolactate synthase-1/2/3 large subunit
MMTGGQAVVHSLQREGIEVVFGLPGFQIMHIYDGLFDTPDLRVITCRHEQSTAYMADGYARSTGKIGVALVVPGPGAYNAAAAMATAYAASSQVMLIVGQIDSSVIGKDTGALHDIHDQLEFMRPVVKWGARTVDPKEVPSLVHEAVRQLRTGRPRPVQIEIPPDTLGTTADIDLIEPEVYPPDEPDAASVRSAADLLASAQRPVIWAGGGVNLSGANAALAEIAELLGAPVITTQDGKGALPEEHPLAAGVSAYAWGPGSMFMTQADVVLAVGSRRGDLRGEPGAKLREDQKLVNVNIDATEFGKLEPLTAGIAADARIGLERITTALRSRTLSTSWSQDEIEEGTRRIADWRRASAPVQIQLVEGMRQAIPRDGVVVADITNLGGWSSLAFETNQPRSFLTASYMGTLGYAFPTALGVKVGNPDRAVVALCGDGGFMYGASELATAVQYGINVVVVVFNNHHFGASNRDQRGRFKGRVIGTELHNPDFVKFAEAFGANGMRAERLEDAPAVIEAAIAANRPTLVEVETPIDLAAPGSLRAPQE